MSIKKKPEPFETPLEDGINTCKRLAEIEDDFRVMLVKLKDGVTIGVRPIQAKGILKIYDALNPDNQATLEKMDLLALLHMYEQAIKDGVLSPPILKLEKGDFDCENMVWLSKRSH